MSAPTARGLSGAAVAEGFQVGGQEFPCCHALRHRAAKVASGEVPLQRKVPSHQPMPLGEITNTIGGVGASLGKRPRAQDPLRMSAQGDGESLEKISRCRSQATTVSTCGSASSTYNASTEDFYDDADIDMDDPQSVAEYAPDIYRNLAQTELSHLARADYMASQEDVNAKMRAILVDWLVEVHLKYKLKVETLYLTVNLIDRYLEVQQVAQKRLQLVGVTAMLIAAKFEEIYPPEVKDFVYISAEAYTKDDILDMEVRMLTKLQFVLCSPTVAPFMERYARINGCTEEHRHLMQYLLELTLPEVCMIKYPPSHLAAAAVLLSNKLLRLHPAWPPAMALATEKTESMVKACAWEMCGILEMVSYEKYSSKAVFRKFSGPKFSRVATNKF
mmetsp:Transcript_22161/g.76012  ORF Transcript_22161/g.76012 Transcript_22161/m.76012 type:complete len:389 (-) Transcript_22161:222-1388(-)